MEVGIGKWVLKTLHYGYVLPLLCPPLLSARSTEFVSYAQGSNRHMSLDLVVQDMLAKGAIGLVVGKLEGFYAHLFLVPKVTGDWRPVFDLLVLNKFLMVPEETLEGSVEPSLVVGSSFPAVSSGPLLVDGSVSFAQGSSLCDGPFTVRVLIWVTLISGFWFPQEQRFHINHLEMMDVFWALQPFQQELSGTVVSLMSDNWTVVAYLRNSGALGLSLCRRVRLCSCDSDCPVVASGKLISSAAESASGPILECCLHGSLCSASLIATSFTSFPEHFTFTRGDFSWKVARFIACLVRQSSARVYQAKWSVFCVV
ncbi:hypothetical protein E2C01_027775 [Portunus trituberculatus]|uniref:Uncharacterized protein n=1 Tax=Portunus trituberculatus TaxID=210409 RepID=A0A5B7EM34_PORTR|nr:hypothetical protein [Portunus trituberculatus]